ncbi:MAG TPA: glycosyltransferase 87 family protein [Candidatus Tyrphobacter sp.]
MNLAPAFGRAWSTVRAPAAILIVGLAVAAYAPAVFHAHGFAMGDFKAFYCSARAVLHHENPYSAVPLGACESQPAPWPLFVARQGAVLPAPLPGYLIGLFTIVAWLPFQAAVVVWLLALIAATISAIAILARVLNLDPWNLAVGLSLILVANALVIGQIVPIAMLGIALAALGARRRSAALVGCGSALAFFEPQVGIAVALVCALLSRRFALVVAVVAVALLLISVTVLGLSENVEYVRTVLPAQALAELHAAIQYSLSWILAGLGMSAGWALRIGQLWWLAMLGAAAWFARSPHARAKPEIAVLAAPAFTVVGGPYLHIHHVALAVPAALWLASTPGRAPWIRIAAAVAICVPLLDIFIMMGRIGFALPLAFVCVVASWLGAAYGRGAIAGLWSALAAVVAVWLVALAFIVGGFGFSGSASMQQLSPATAQASWAQFVATHYVATGWPIWLVKAPTWFGVLATAIGLMAAARGYGISRHASGKGVV